MLTLVTRAYRLAAALLLGAQLFFAAVAAQAAFPPEVAALPRGHAARIAAADLVGRMLSSLDRWTLSLSALCVLCAVLLSRAGHGRALRSALPPLLAGLCAASSALLFTPWIHELRAAGQTQGPAFGRLHGASTGLLLVEMLLLVWALAIAPAAPPAEASGARGN